MTPDHRHSAPAMDSVSSTAADAPSIAAAVTSPSVPYTAPHTSDAVTNSVHTMAIVMHITSRTGTSYAGALHIICGITRLFDEQRLTELAKCVIIQPSIVRTFVTTA